MPIGKLGKKAPRFDPKGLLLANYLKPDKLPPPRTENYWGGGNTRGPGGWGMLMNDSIGDCTIAAAAHLIEMWTMDVGRPVSVRDIDVLSAYEVVGGYVPGDPSTDNGCVLLDVLTYWRDTGIAGHKILGHMAIEPGNLSLIRMGIDLFGAAYIGLALPMTAQSQGAVWSVVANAGAAGQPNSWGGHSVPVIGYNQDYFLCVTWGALQWMTVGWWQQYCDEAYAVWSPDWIGSRGETPTHLDMAAAETDLNALGTA